MDPITEFEEVSFEAFPHETEIILTVPQMIMLQAHVVEVFREPDFSQFEKRLERLFKEYANRFARRK